MWHDEAWAYSIANEYAVGTRFLVYYDLGSTFFGGPPPWCSGRTSHLYLLIGAIILFTSVASYMVLG